MGASYLPAVPGIVLIPLLGKLKDQRLLALALG
jgi:hypothetical protein